MPAIAIMKSLSSISPSGRNGWRSRVILEQIFIGLTFAPDGKTLYASGGEFDRIHMFDFQDGYLTNEGELPIPSPKSGKFIPGGLAMHPNGKTLCIAGVWGHGVYLMPVSNPKDGVMLPLGEECIPKLLPGRCQGQTALRQPVEQSLPPPLRFNKLSLPCTASRGSPGSAVRWTWSESA